RSARFGGSERIGLRGFGMRRRSVVAFAQEARDGASSRCLLRYARPEFFLERWVRSRCRYRRDGAARPLRSRQQVQSHRAIGEGPGWSVPSLHVAPRLPPLGLRATSAPLMERWLECRARSLRSVAVCRSAETQKER